MKILIVRFSSIGDIVLTTPVIRCLKTQLDDSEIHFATKKSFSNILAQNPYVDKVHSLDENFGEFATNLKKENFDLIIDLHKNLRTLRLKIKLGIKSYSFDKINFQKWLLVKFKVNKLPNKHIVDRYMDTVSSLGVKMDNFGLDFFIPEKDDVPLDWLPESHRNGFVSFVIGATHATKKLPTTRIIEVCDRINKPVLLIGGKDVQDIGVEVESFFMKKENDIHEETLQKELGKKAVVFNGCGKFNLNQSASLIKKSRAVFSHDTGLMHIAAAFGKKVFSIWGNTVPEFGMYPYRTSFTVFENKKIGCRPCSKIGFDKCPKGHFKCMNDIVFDFYIPET